MNRREFITLLGCGDAGDRVPQRLSA